jgi:hypothetical protein
MMGALNRQENGKLRGAVESKRMKGNQAIQVKSPKTKRKVRFD